MLPRRENATPRTARRQAGIVLRDQAHRPDRAQGRRDDPGAVDELKGWIWRRVIERSALPVVEREHTVISTKLLTGRTVVHVHGDASRFSEEEYQKRSFLVQVEKQVLLDLSTID